MNAAMAYGAPEGADNSRGAQLVAQFNRKFQHYLDKSVPHIKERWAGWGFAALVYLIRISFLHGWYIVTYGLGIYNLNLIIGFLSPPRWIPRRKDRRSRRRGTRSSGPSCVGCRSSSSGTAAPRASSSPSA